MQEFHINFFQIRPKLTGRSLILNPYYLGISDIPLNNNLLEDLVLLWRNSDN